MPLTDHRLRWWASTVSALAYLFFLLLSLAATRSANGIPSLVSTQVAHGEFSAVAPSSVAPSSVDPLAVNPLALSPEMRTFIDKRVSRGLPRTVRLLNLQDAIFNPHNGLGVTYGSAVTYTAEETFRSRSGNCLSFTLLFVSLARHLGLNASFVEVDEVTGWSQRGSIALSHWHMYAQVELDNAIMKVDFLPWAERRYFSARRVDETRVQAHYHSNVGADRMSAGEVDQAVSHFQRALALDPNFYPAKVNLAVAYRRSGDSDRAIAALLEVLEKEPGNPVAATNLAALLLAEGRKSEAEKWIGKRDKFQQRNPFHHFRLGVAALEENDPRAARNHLRRAIARQPQESIFFERLADCYFQLERPRRARAHLRRALELTEDEEHRTRLEQRLQNATPLADLDPKSSR